MAFPRLTRRLLALAASALAVVAIAADATPATAAFPGRNGKLVLDDYGAYPRGNLYLLDPDGSHPVRVSQGVGSDLEPSFSADGRKIVFRRYRRTGGGLYVVNADGSGQRAVPGSNAGFARPAFAPDGTTIAFDYPGEGISTIDVDGHYVETITYNPRSRGPVYSPDGRHVAFTHRDFQTGVDEAYITRSDGTDTRRLTKYGSPLSFSPDGRRLVLARDEHLYVLGLGDHRLKRLTNGRFDDTDAVYSPDGGQIAFIRHESAAFGDFSQVGVWVMRADGSHKRRISTKPTYSLDWQPLGGWQPNW